MAAIFSDSGPLARPERKPASRSITAADLLVGIGLLGLAIALAFVHPAISLGFIGVVLVAAGLALKLKERTCSRDSSSTSSVV